MRFVGVSAVLPTLDEQIDMGIFDAFQIPYSALQRDHEEVISRASDAGSGHHHPRRRGPGRPRRLGRPPLLHGLQRHHARLLGDRQARRTARRHEPHGVHAALHAVAPRPGHHHRRHTQHRTSAATTWPRPRTAHSPTTCSTKPRTGSRPPAPDHFKPRGPPTAAGVSRQAAQQGPERALKSSTALTRAEARIGTSGAASYDPLLRAGRRPLVADIRRAILVVALH